MNNFLFSLATVGETIVTSLNNSFGRIGYLIFVNAFGVIAMIIKIIETQSKKRSRIIVFAMSCSCCWTVYFLLNGDFTSSIISLIGIVQALIFMQRGKHKWANNIAWLIVFLVAQALICVFTWKGPVSLLSVIAGMIGTVAYYVMSERVYRFLTLALFLFWVANSVVNFYPMALINDVFGTISITIAIVRYEIAGKKARKTLEKIKQEEKEKELVGQED